MRRLKICSSVSAELPTYFCTCETPWNELPLTCGTFSALFRCDHFGSPFYCHIYLGKIFYFSTLELAVTTNSLEKWALKGPFSTDSKPIRSSAVRNPAWPLYQLDIQITFVQYGWTPLATHKYLFLSLSLSLNINIPLCRFIETGQNDQHWKMCSFGLANGE